MEKLKEPEMFLSVANSAGLFCVAGYFYKQLELIKQEQEKTGKALAFILKKITELETSNKGKTEVIKEINSQLKTINEHVATLEEDVIPDVDEIIHTLEENGMNVERQAYVPPKYQKKQTRGGRSRDTDTDVSVRSNRSSRQEKRPTTSRQRQDSDDDADLINAVREDSRHAEEEFTARR